MRICWAKVAKMLSFAKPDRPKRPANHPLAQLSVRKIVTPRGGKVSVLNSAGEEEVSVSGPGQISMNNCQALFETAVKARDRAIADQSFYHIYECLTFGFSSIEAFFNTAASNWNRKNPDHPLIDDSTNKVSLEDKILEWIPVMSGGKPFDRGNRQWSDFKNPKCIRNKSAIHPAGGQGMTLKEMVNHLNAFRHGIAHLLGNLHVLVHGVVHAVIINAIYYPDVEVVKVQKGS